MLDKRWRLLHILIQRTQESRINWDIGPADNLMYANVGGLGIGVRPFGQDMHLLLFNEDGNIVETISDVDFSAEGYSNPYPVMKALYDLATADATGSEKVVDTLLEILNRD